MTKFDLRSVVALTRFGLDAGRELLRYEVERRVFPPEQLDDRRAKARVRVATALLRDLQVELVGTYPTLPTPALLVANHRSALDIGIFLRGIDTIFLSREDVADWPILGSLATHGQTIYVDRESRKSGARAVRAIRDALQAGRRVVVFPEGRTLIGDTVGEFKRGSIAAIAGTGIPVIPVGIAYPPGSEYVNKPFTQHLAEIVAQRPCRVAFSFGPALANPSPEDARKAVQTEVHVARQMLSV